MSSTRNAPSVPYLVSTALLKKSGKIPLFYSPFPFHNPVMSILHPEQLHIMFFFPFPCLPPLTKLLAPFSWIAAKIILRLLYPVLSLPPNPFFESQSDLLKCNLRNLFKMTNYVQVYHLPLSLNTLTKII